MSVINLSAHFVTPDYPALYMVHSEVMDEAATRGGGKFDGTVGMLQVPPKLEWEYTLQFTPLPDSGIGFRDPGNLAQPGMTEDDEDNPVTVRVPQMGTTSDELGSMNHCIVMRRTSLFDHW